MILETEDRSRAASPLAGVSSKRRPARSWRPGSVVAYLAFAGAIALSAGTLLRIQLASYTAIPFWDAWDELFAVQAAVAGRLRLYDLWVQHNEHRILVPRLQFVADYTLFGGRLVFLLAMLSASLICLAVALALPAASVWRDRKVSLGFAAVTFAAMLSPIGLENIAWPFQVSFVQVELFAVSAIAAAAYGRGAPSVAAIVVAGVAATYSLADGLLVWPVAIAVMLLRGRSKRSLATVVFAAVLAAVSYLWDYTPVPQHASYTNSIEHPVGVAHYVVVYLGHPAVSLGSHAEDAVGLLGVGLFLILAWLAVRDRTLLPARPALFGGAIALFVFLTAFQTAIGRLSFGIAQALSSRYSLPASVFWTGLIVGWAPYVKRIATVTLARGAGRTDVTGLAYVSVCLAAWISLNLVATPSAEALRGIQTRGEPMLAAFVSDVQDPQASSVDYPTPNAILDRVAWLREERLGPWDGGIGDRLEDAQRFVPQLLRLPSCAGSVDSTGAVTGGERFSGWIAAPAGRGASDEVDVLSRRGNSLGVGIVDGYRPDVVAAGAAATSHTGFVAYARSGTAAAAVVLFERGSLRPLCILSIPQS